MVTFQRAALRAARWNAAIGGAGVCGCGSVWVWEWGSRLIEATVLGRDGYHAVRAYGAGGIATP